MLRNLTLSAFAILLLCGCRETAKPHDIVFPLQQGAADSVGNAVVGCWTSSDNIWYTSELRLLQNGSFTFYDQGCTGYRYSEGDWVINNSIVVLSSYDRYRPKEDDVAPIETNEQVEDTDTTTVIYWDQWEKTHASEQIESTSTYTLTFDPNVFKEKTFLPTEFKNPTAYDSMSVYFDNVRLQVKRDTLAGMEASGIFSGSLFRRSTQLVLNRP